MTKEELIQAVEQMSVLELADLVKALEERFGVSAAAPMVMAAGPADVAEEVEEQTEFDVVLQDVGDKKIQVIKVVRQLTSLGLKEAKDLVESAPVKVMEAVTKEEGEKAKAALEAEGAKASLQ